MPSDEMIDTEDMAHPHVPYRRRTMATAEFKEFISTKGSEPKDFGINHSIPDCAPPATSSPTTTRRMSIGESINGKIYDWEQPRLDIEGFVVDYFSHRIRQSGFEWFDAPNVPSGVQPEHEMMRVLGSIFEKKHREQFDNFAEQLLAVPRITFSLYSEVVQAVGNSSGPCPMSYGRLIGLISFGGMLASRMMGNPELQGRVRNLWTYTALFIKTRIRQSWKEHNRSWEDFMILGASMKAENEREELEKQLREKKKNRRWSVGAGVAAGAIGLVGIVAFGRIIFSYK
ncbi:unnamed protein product [Caenorhabditis sp. 36 PRJEB53466]|nr:unnamed protein product [Caenorhabditis sp. 36 PRJEB53466]